MEGGRVRSYTRRGGQSRVRASRPWRRDALAGSENGEDGTVEVR